MNLTMGSETAKHVIEKIDNGDIIGVDKETITLIRQRSLEQVDKILDKKRID